MTKMCASNANDEVTEICARDAEGKMSHIYQVNCMLNEFMNSIMNIYEQYNE